jgi:hypothetical protein
MFVNATDFFPEAKIQVTIIPPFPSHQAPPVTKIPMPRFSGFPEVN